MILRFKLKSPRLTPYPQLLIIGFILTRRHKLVGQIRYRMKKGLQLPLHISKGLFRSL